MKLRALLATLLVSACNYTENLPERISIYINNETPFDSAVWATLERLDEAHPVVHEFEFRNGNVLNAKYGGAVPEVEVELFDQTGTSSLGFGPHPYPPVKITVTALTMGYSYGASKVTEEGESPSYAKFRLAFSDVTGSLGIIVR